MGGRRNAYRILVGKPETLKAFGRRRRRREDDIKITINKRDSKVWTGLMWLGYVSVTGSCEHNNQTLNTTKCGQFLN